MLWFIPAKMPISINSPVSLNGFRPSAVAKSRTMTGGLKWMILMSPDAITVTEGVEAGTGTGGAASGREIGGGGGTHGGGRRQRRSGHRGGRRRDGDGRRVNHGRRRRWAPEALPAGPAAAAASRGPAGSPGEPQPADGVGIGGAVRITGGPPDAGPETPPADGWPWPAPPSRGRCPART